MLIYIWLGPYEFRSHGTVFPSGNTLPLAVMSCICRVIFSELRVVSKSKSPSPSASFSRLSKLFRVSYFFAQHLESATNTNDYGSGFMMTLKFLESVLSYSNNSYRRQNFYFRGE